MFLKASQLIEKIQNGLYDDELKKLYATNDIALQKTRYIDAVKAHIEAYGDVLSAVFSAPGRTEIGGNHTDHQHGKVLAAAVTMDMIAVVTPTDDSTIDIKSEGYPNIVVHLAENELEINENDFGTSTALVRGVAKGILNNGGKVGGFKASVFSAVPKGSGVSSSAAYEVLIGTILNKIYNNGEITPVKIAQIGQFAEKDFFGKPCGLLDQTTSAVGGFVSIDFINPESPKVEKIDCNIVEKGFTICIVNAGGNHANLTPEYAAIPNEMRQVANFFGKDFLSELDKNTVMLNMKELRKKVSDRAILRALHYFDDDSRAVEEANALRNNQIYYFLQLIKESGESSQEQLQNIYPVCDENERSVALALTITKSMLKDGNGAWRVHGGGFAGTMQAFVKNDMLNSYCKVMQNIFGEENVHILSIRPIGGYCLGENSL